LVTSSFSEREDLGIAEREGARGTEKSLKQKPRSKERASSKRCETVVARSAGIVNATAVSTDVARGGKRREMVRTYFDVLARGVNSTFNPIC